MYAFFFSKYFGNQLLCCKINILVSLWNSTSRLIGFLIDLQVGYSSPARSGVMNDLGLTVAQVCIIFPLIWMEHVCVCVIVCVLRLLSILQYSVFGSILTIGAMIGAVVSGRIADYIGRRGVSFFLPFNFSHFK